MSFALNTGFHNTIFLLSVTKEVTTENSEVTDSYEDRVQELAMHIQLRDIWMKWTMFSDSAWA